MSNLWYRPKHHISSCTSNVFSFMRIAPSAKEINSQITQLCLCTEYRLLLITKLKHELHYQWHSITFIFIFAQKYSCDVADLKTVNQGTTVSYSVADNNTGSTFLVTSKIYRQSLIICRFFMSLTVSLKFDKMTRKFRQGYSSFEHVRAIWSGIYSYNLKKVYW